MHANLICGIYQEKYGFLQVLPNKFWICCSLQNKYTESPGYRLPLTCFLFYSIASKIRTFMWHLRKMFLPPRVDFKAPSPSPFYPNSIGQHQLHPAPRLHRLCPPKLPYLLIFFLFLFFGMGGESPSSAMSQNSISSQCWVFIMVLQVSLCPFYIFNYT